MTGTKIYTRHACQLFLPLSVLLLCIAFAPFSLMLSRPVHCLACTAMLCILPNPPSGFHIPMAGVTPKSEAYFEYPAGGGRCSSGLNPHAPDVGEQPAPGV